MLRKYLLYILIAFTLSACQKTAVVKDASPESAAKETELSGIISTDTTIGGTIRVTKDVYVSEGVTLTILPGAAVIFKKSESTKVTPFYLSSNTEILVRGGIVANGTKEEKIKFSAATNGGEMKDYAGIILLKSKKAAFSNCEFQGAEAAVLAIKTSVDIRDTAFYGCFYALSSNSSKIRAENCTVKGCDKGFYFHADSMGHVKNSAFTDNLEDGIFISKRSVMEISDNLFKGNLIGVSTIMVKEPFFDNNTFDGNKEDIRGLNYQ